MDIPLTRFGLDTDTDLHKDAVEGLERLVELQDAVCVQVHDGVTWLRGHVNPTHVTAFV